MSAASHGPNGGPRGGRPAAGRVYELVLHLLDRQVVDPQGRMVAKVDDLELSEVEGSPGSYQVTAILTGPLALGPRLGGRLGHWVAAIAARLATDPHPEPRRIDMALVQQIGSAVTLAVRHDQLDVAPLEDWLGTYLIDRIPGADHESQ